MDTIHLKFAVQMVGLIIVGMGFVVDSWRMSIVGVLIMMA